MQPTTERGSVGSTTSPLHPGRAAGRRAAVVATATLLALIGAACSTPSGPPSAPTSTAAPSVDDHGTDIGPEDDRQGRVAGPGRQDRRGAAGTGLSGAVAHPARGVRGGVRHHETRREEPAAVDTHFRIGSITKTMTSAATLLLAQEGKLSLDDPVTKYIPDVPNGDNITIAQLLEMRSGLYNFTNSPAITTRMDDDPTKVWKPQQLLDIAFAQPPNFAPGAEYEYNNTNYVLLGLIVEKLDGQPIATVFEERFFKPLGMTDTSFPAAASNAIPEPFSHGYMYGGASTVMTGSPPYTPAMAAEARAGTLQPKDYTDVNHSFAWAAGAVISTAADLATWMKALSGGKVFNAEYQRIWQDSAEIINPANSYNWYGYGIDQLRWGKHVLDLHGGQTTGYNAEAGHDPATDMTLVIWGNLTMSLDNKYTAEFLTLKVLDQIYVESPLPPTPAASVSPTGSSGR